MISIIADYREETSEVVYRLAELGVEVKLRRLEVGDYVVSDRMGVERKTAMDFASSIADRRLFEQANAMVKTFSIPVFIVEGDLGEIYLKRRFTPSQVQGAIAYLIDLGVHVAPSTNPSDTAQLIYSLAKREQRAYGRPVQVSLSKMRRARGGKSLKEAQLNLIASIPGIGYELAERILRTFGSPRRFFKASPLELRRVPGMGEGRINKVAEVLDTKFEAMEFLGD